jgi:hypothetical protein
MRIGENNGDHANTLRLCSHCHDAAVDKIRIEIARYRCGSTRSHGRARLVCRSNSAGVAS